MLRNLYTVLKERRLRLTLVFLITAQPLLVLLISVIYSNNIINNSFLLISIFGILISILLLYVFISKIYLPLTKVEMILHSSVTDEVDIKISEKELNGPLSAIFKDLELLFGRIETLAIRESNAQLLKKQAEIDALQSQINPHFLYNALECIRGQALVHGVHEIDMMASSLAKLFRYSISNKNEFVNLSEELNKIDSYLTIQNIRFDNKFQIMKQVDSDTLDLKIPKLIVQPIVENAIKHGLEPKVSKGLLIIIAYRTKNRLIIVIQDDGLGISKSNLIQLNEILAGDKASDNLIKNHNDRTSVGICNVQNRIKLLFGNEYGIAITSAEGGGTTVSYSLPIIT
jgi:sensor histidine kinase YesM